MTQLNKNYKEIKNRPIEIMQFGEGNFLRCFIEWIIKRLNDNNVINSNIVVVQPIEFGRVDALKAQDGLYTTILEGLDNSKMVSQREINDTLGDFINPYTDYDKFMEYSKSLELKYIISNTTEAGIVFDETDTDFTKTPKTYPGKLLSLLYSRYNYFNGSKESALDIIPCELIDYNGLKLKEALVNLSKVKGFSDEFINWLTNDNRFYNTLVDRIVPGYPKNDALRFEKELGYHDDNMVKGEFFHLWVIEDHYDLKSRWNIEGINELNVKFVDDFRPYKERKVKILNGSHTCMVPISYLYGIDTVGETMENEKMNKLVKEFIFNEVIPTISLPKDDMDRFANSVLERYANPFIRHELMSISLNSITKFKTRILPTIEFDLKNNNFPRIALFSLSALMTFYFGERKVNNTTINLTDNKEFLSLFNEYKNSYNHTLESAKNIVKDFLSLESHWETKALMSDEVVDYVSNYFYQMNELGMVEVLDKFYESL